MVYNGSISNYQTCDGAFVVSLVSECGNPTVTLSAGKYKKVLLKQEILDPLRICCAVSEPKLRSCSLCRY